MSEPKKPSPELLERIPELVEVMAGLNTDDFDDVMNMLRQVPEEAPEVRRLTAAAIGEILSEEKD